jgi:class 3 adenylate cyclase
MFDPASSLVKARQRISTLLLAILAGIAALLVLGLTVIGLRLFEIRTELDELRDQALPRLVKLAQLSQEASATSSIAPALSMNPTRSEFDTLLSRIRDKESSQRALIAELSDLFREADRVDSLQRSADLLIANLAGLTDAVADQIAVGQRLEVKGEDFGQLLRKLRKADGVGDGETEALATQAVFQVNNMLLDMNRARFARNRRETEASMEVLALNLPAVPADQLTESSQPFAAAQAIAELWLASGEEILAEKSAQLSNAFQIKALAEENSLIANRLLSSASNEFWRAGSELETQVGLVNETTRFTLMAIFGVVATLGAGNFLVWQVLRKRVFLRLDRMRASLQKFAENRQHALNDPRPDEIGEISGAMAHYMAVIDQREMELAEKTTVLERLSNQLAKYLSPQVYDSIFTGKQEVKLASSRKKLTIFFSDIAGFTETADRLESEELTQLLNHYLTEMSQIALRHGATIDKYVGDAILIFFGDPETRGVREDALSCVRMAIDMRRRMGELQALWRESGIEKPLRVRMGIHTDYCTVGNFGSEDRLDYTIIGGAVNIASRLESLAAPGEILISYETFAHVNAEIACKPRGQTEVKGIAYPVATYCVLDSHEALEGEKGSLHEQQKHLRLDLDLASMTAEECEAAAKSLTRALRLLKQRSLEGPRTGFERSSGNDLPSEASSECPGRG